MRISPLQDCFFLFCILCCLVKLFKNSQKYLISSDESLNLLWFLTWHLFQITELMMRWRCGHAWFVLFLLTCSNVSTTFIHVFKDWP